MYILDMNTFSDKYTLCIFPICSLPIHFPNDVFLLLKFYLFIFWLRWVFVAVRGLSLVAGVVVSLFCGAQALSTRAAVVMARGFW